VVKFFGQRFGFGGSPGRADVSTGPTPQQCPSCGSARLSRKKASSTATYRLDGERSIARPFKQTQVHCRKCEFLVNDDLYGDAQIAYEQLAEQAGIRAPQIWVAAEVSNAMREVGRLPALSDAERQQDYDTVARPWGCAGMHTIPESELEETLTRIFRGYFAEGAYRDEMQTLDQGVVLLSFFTAAGWRPVRLARTTRGHFVAYGQIQLYRILGAGQHE